jgi:hypothetical protein
VPSFVVRAEDAAEGKQSALLTLGSVTGRGGRLGQKVAAGEAGQSYTFAVLARAPGGPVSAHLEIEAAGRQAGRPVKGKNALVPENTRGRGGEWTELHLEFNAESLRAENWFACLTSAQEGARLEVDAFRLYRGPHLPGKLPEGAKNLLANPGFEDGTQPWSFDYHEQQNLRRTYRRASFLLGRLLANLGAAGETPLLDRFKSPVGAAEKRWRSGFYLDEPEEWDDPYRFFRW